MAMTNEQVVALQLEKVRKKVPILYDRKATFYSTIEKRQVEVISTRDMRIPLKLRPGGRFGHFDPAGGDLGRGEGPTYDKAVINTVNFRYAVEYQTKAEWGTDDARKAVEQVIKDRTADAMVEFRRASDAMCQTAGDGVVGTISVAATSAGKDTYTMGTDGFGVKLMRFGQMLSVYNAALTTRRTFTGGASEGGEAPIDLYDLDAKQVRFNGAVAGVVATDKLVVSGLGTTPPVSLYGLPYHMSNASTGTWLGLDRATVPEIRANRVAAGGALALPYPRLAINKIGDRLGDDYKAMVTAWMHPCQKQAYEELGQLVSMIQKQPKEEALNLYFGDGMQMAGAPISDTFMWDKKRIDFIVNEVFGRAELHAPDVYSVGGRKIFEIRGASGGVAASQVFYMVASWNLFVDNPAALSYIDTLAVPSGY